jgi:hypothetical protein
VPFPITSREKTALTWLGILLVLGLIGMLVL